MVTLFNFDRRHAYYVEATYFSVKWNVKTQFHQSVEHVVI